MAYQRPKLHVMIMAELSGSMPATIAVIRLNMMITASHGRYCVSTATTLNAAIQLRCLKPISSWRYEFIDTLQAVLRHSIVFVNNSQTLPDNNATRSSAATLKT